MRRRIGNIPQRKKNNSYKENQNKEQRIPSRKIKSETGFLERRFMAEKRELQMKEITEQLEQGVKELFTSEMYTEYLRTMSQFHNYSFNNTLLIAMQKLEASLVAGYKAWQKNFERHVNKGEKAIRILAPAPYKIKEECIVSMIWTKK